MVFHLHACGFFNTEYTSMDKMRLVHLREVFSVTLNAD